VFKIQIYLSSGGEVIY